jgi:hypothetical protein
MLVPVNRGGGSLLHSRTALLLNILFGRVLLWVVHCSPSFPFENIFKWLKLFLFWLSLWVGANGLKAVCKQFLGLGSYLWLYYGQITRSDPPDEPKEPAHQHTIYKLFYVKGSKLFIYPLICPCLQTKSKWLGTWVRLRLLNWTLTNSVWADINVSNGLR